MTRIASEIAEYLGCVLEGDGSVRVSGVAAPDTAQASDLIYVETERHLEQAAASKALCAVIAPGLILDGKTRLRSARPKLAFARAAAWLAPPAPIASGIHPTAVIAANARLAPGAAVGPFAVIEEGAEVGANSEVGAYCFLGRGCRLGEGCRLYPRVTLYPGAWLGNRVIVHAGAVIGADGFGYVEGEGKHWKFPQVGKIEIGDDVEIGANATIDRGSLGCTQIASGVKLDNLVHIAHNVQIGNDTVIAAQTGVSGSAVIGRHVAFGGQVGVADHCRIEDGATVGAQAGIPTKKVIRSGQVVWGTPARALGAFKKQFAWFERLPELARRVQELEQGRKSAKA